MAPNGSSTFAFGTTVDNKWVFARLTDAGPMAELAADQSEAWRELGVSILHCLVLDHLVKTKIDGADPQCKYVRLIEEVTEAQKEGRCQLGCLVPPAAWTR